MIIRCQIIYSFEKSVVQSNTNAIFHYMNKIICKHKLFCVSWEGSRTTENWGIKNIYIVLYNIYIVIFFTSN